MSDIKIFGRQAEIQLMQNWISNTNTGYFIIWGVPGIGKSLLLSEINNIMKSSPNFQE
jgi:replication-associated recombination protein RarA